MVIHKGLNMMTCGGNNCYVVRGSKGDILIDTGAAADRFEIEAWLRGFDIRLIILTHGHNDHIGNAAYFSKLFGAPVMIDPYDMRLARDNLCREYFTLTLSGRLSGKRLRREMSERAEKFDPKIFAVDGMDLSPYGIDGRTVNLEGHTKGSMGVLCRGEFGYDLYAGDAVMNISSPSLPVTAESPRRARETLRHIDRLCPERILCGHGEPIWGKELMLKCCRGMAG